MCQCSFHLARTYIYRVPEMLLRSGIGGPKISSLKLEFEIWICMVVQWSLQETLKLPPAWRQVCTRRRCILLNTRWMVAGVTCSIFCVMAVCSSCNVWRLFLYTIPLSAPHRRYETNYRSCAILSNLKLRYYAALSPHFIVYFLTAQLLFDTQ